MFKYKCQKAHQAVHIQLLIAGFLTIICANVDASPNNLSNLDHLPILQRQITIDADPISLNSLCRKLSDKTVVLQCSTVIQHQKLQMHLINRPLYQIMDAISKLLPGVWVPGLTQNSFVLEPSNSLIQKENTWWDLYQQVVQRYNNLERHSLIHALESAYTPVLPSVEIDPEQAKQDNQLDGPLHNFFMQLPPALIHRIVTSTEPQLSKDSKVQVVGAADLFIPFNQLSHSDQQILSQFGNTFMKPGAIGPNLNNLIALNPPVCFTCSSGITCFTVNPDGKQGALLPFPDGTANFNLFLSPPSLAAQMNQAPLLKYVQGHISQAGYLYRSLASYQRTTFWNINPAAVLPPPVIPKGPYFSSPRESVQSTLMQENVSPLRRSDQLNWLERQTGMEYISDYYSLAEKPMDPAQENEPLTTTLNLELDKMEATNDCSWRKISSGIVLVRDNRWYRDDRLEVPQSILESWVNQLPNSTESYSTMESTFKDLRSAMVIQLAVSEDAMKKLTPYQIEYGLKYFVREPKHGLFNTDSPRYVLRPFERTSDLLEQAQPFMQFFMSLTADQQKLLEHHALKASMLNQEQATLAIQAIPQLYYAVRNIAVAPSVTLQILMTPQFGFFGGQLPNPGMYITANGCLPAICPQLGIRHPNTFAKLAEGQ